MSSLKKKLHPRIEALRNSVGHLPIQIFNASRKTSVDLTNKGIPKVVKKDNPADEREIEQYFAVFGVIDDFRTRPMKGCFGKSISERGPSSSVPGKIIVLDQHRQMMPVCLPSELKEDEIGLYGRYSPDPIPRCDDLIVQIRRGTINNGSYGFGYIWEKMEYSDKDDCIDMFEVRLEEVSPVTFGSQRDTFVLRNQSGLYVPLDEELIEDTEDFIKSLPKEVRLQARTLITRHISLALTQPVQPLSKRGKPRKQAINYEELIDNLKF